MNDPKQKIVQWLEENFRREQQEQRDWDREVTQGMVVCLIISVVGGVLIGYGAPMLLLR